MTENEQLWADYERATKKLKGMSKQGGGAENDFAAAYQALVKAGLAQQLRGKYRG